MAADNFELEFEFEVGAESPIAYAAILKACNVQKCFYLEIWRLRDLTDDEMKVFEEEDFVEQGIRDTLEIGIHPHFEWVTLQWDPPIKLGGGGGVGCCRIMPDEDDEPYEEMLETIKNIFEM